MNTERIHVGDTVRIKNLSRDFNGLVGRVVGKNGEYHYVDVMLDGQTLNLEAYACELTKEGVFAEELFEI